MSRSEEHTSELQSLRHLVCRLLLEKKKKKKIKTLTREHTSPVISSARQSSRCSVRHAVLLLCYCLCLFCLSFFFFFFFFFLMMRRPRNSPFFPSPPLFG